MRRELHELVANQDESEAVEYVVREYLRLIRAGKLRPDASTPRTSRDGPHV